MGFWQKIHSLPEEARRMLAMFLIIAAAGALFLLWGKVMSSRLTVISPSETVSQQAVVPSTEKSQEDAPSPTAGIIDTLKSIERLWGQ